MIDRTDLLGNRVESLMRTANSQNDEISVVKDDVNVLKAKNSLLESQVSVLESQIDLFISSDSESNMEKEYRQKIREIKRGIENIEKRIEENGKRIEENGEIIEDIGKQIIFLESFMKPNEDEDNYSDIDNVSHRQEVDDRELDIVIEIKQKDDLVKPLLFIFSACCITSIIHHILDKN